MAERINWYILKRISSKRELNSETGVQNWLVLGYSPVLLPLCYDMVWFDLVSFFSLGHEDLYAINVKVILVEEQ